MEIRFWHCTNECFNVEEFIRANCEYPGEWEGEVERIEKIGNGLQSNENCWRLLQ